MTDKVICPKWKECNTFFCKGLRPHIKLSGCGTDKETNCPACVPCNSKGEVIENGK